MTKRALITGVAGQDGTYLTDLLVAKGYQVFGVLGPAPGAFLDRIPAWGDAFTGVQADMTDTESLHARGRRDAPRRGLQLRGHLLGGAVVGPGRARRQRERRRRGAAARGRFATSLPARASARRPRPRSSAARRRCRRTRTRPSRPVSPYGDSKAYGHFVTGTYRDAHGIHANNAILYNHESPLRPVSFVTAKIADGAARIKLGLASDLQLGNLDVRRDWGFAGDYVRAMWLMLQADAPSDFVDLHRRRALGARRVRVRVRARRARLRGLRAREPGLLPTRRGRGPGRRLRARRARLWAGSPRSASTSSSA